MYAEVFLPWVCNRVGGQSSSIQRQNREHQCNDVVNLVLTLNPGLVNFFDLVFEPGPNLAPQDKATLSLHTSVNLRIPCCYFPLQCSIHPIFEAKDTSYCHFPRVLAGCWAVCYWPSSKTSRVILTLQSTSMPTHTCKLQKNNSSRFNQVTRCPDWSPKRCTKLLIISDLIFFYICHDRSCHWWIPDGFVIFLLEFKTQRSIQWLSPKSSERSCLSLKVKANLHPRKDCFLQLQMQTSKRNGNRQEPSASSCYVTFADQNLIPSPIQILQFKGRLNEHLYSELSREFGTF